MATHLLSIDYFALLSLLPTTTDYRPGAAHRTRSRVRRRLLLLLLLRRRRRRRRRRPPRAQTVPDRQPVPLLKF